MIKSTIAALAASPLLLSGAAFAGPYVNVEASGSYPDGLYTSGTIETVVGYEGETPSGLGWYVAGGPTVTHSESTDDTETELSGKVGASYGVNEDLALYGEISGASNGEDSSGDNIVDWGAKVGAKFTF